MKKETWKAVIGYEGLYEVSDLGRVKSLSFRNRMATKKRELILSLAVNSRGYPRVTLGNKGIKRGHFVHHLVLMAFSGKCPKGMEAAHENGKRLDNRSDNLSWKTHTDNQADQRRHGTAAIGEAHGSSRLTEDNIRGIRAQMAMGVEQKQIAKSYGVTPTTICDIINGRTWTHLQNSALNGHPPTKGEGV